MRVPKACNSPNGVIAMKASNPHELRSGGPFVPAISNAAEIVSRECWASLRTTQRLFEGSTVLGTHYVVEDRVYRCTKVVKASS